MRYEEAKPHLKKGMKLHYTRCDQGERDCRETFYDILEEQIRSQNNLGKLDHWPITDELLEFEILTQEDGITPWIHPDKQEFKVGDRVKVIKIDREWPYYVNSLNKALDKIGTITAFVNSYDFVTVEIDGEQCRPWNYCKDWLEKIEEPENKGIVDSLTLKQTTLNNAIQEVVQNWSLIQSPRFYPESYKFERPILIRWDSGPTPKKGFMSNIVQKIKDLALSDTDRILRKHNLEDNCSNPTEDAIGMMHDEIIKERWATRREAIAQDLAKIDAAEKK